MDISLTELFHLLFPSETNEHDEAYSYGIRNIAGFSKFDAVVVSDTLAKRIVEVQTAANVELMVVQRIDRFNYVFTRRSWHESPYRMLILRQRSDALRAAAVAAAESKAAADAWRVEVHAYMGKLAIAIADRTQITKIGFLKNALQDMAARLQYDLDRIRNELGALFGYDDNELDALFVAPPVKDKTNEQHRRSSDEDPPSARTVEDCASAASQDGTASPCGAGEIQQSGGGDEQGGGASEQEGTDADNTGVDATAQDAEPTQG